MELNIVQKKITVGDWREILKLNEKYESENSIKDAANIN